MSILNENKLLFDELVVLDQHVEMINVLAHWNNSPRV